MALDPKKLKEIKQLIKEIDEEYSKLGKSKGFNIDIQNIQDADATINHLNGVLEKVINKSELVNSSFGDLVDILKSVRVEMEKGGSTQEQIERSRSKAATKMKNSYDSIITQASKLKYEEQGYGIESKKSIEKMLEKAKTQKNFAMDQAKDALRGIKFNKKSNRFVDERTGKFVKLTEKADEEWKEHPYSINPYWTGYS